jgi:soluble lytic murein transglycosylase-like protein
MTLMSSTPAASRIAEIRASIGARTQTPQRSGGFSERLNAALGAELDAPAAAPIDATVVAATRFDLQPDLPTPSSGRVGSETPFAELFNQAGERHGVDPRLLASVAEIESGFNPNAISPVGAGGLMQFMPATATEMGVDAFDPVSAVDGAARYLARDLERFGRVELALAAYNAGPGAVHAHGGVPPYAETQRYVEKVLNSMEATR